MAAPPAPHPCQEYDLGKFEILARDGASRIGRLHTKHGPLNTPMLLPVINPNIRTIEPKEMWEKFGIGGIITNSYIIWKHDKLKNLILEKGVHEVLDFPGVIVTDSGTFQSYVYGDVEVGVSEIVQFQKDIGVDIGTMLDIFGRPDMSRSQLEYAVEETANRATESLKVAGNNLLLNGPIQGGLHEDLRALSGSLMSSIEGEHRNFAIHPIGGIVPLMENQRYKELFQILLSSKSEIPANRPIHFFGCGHPLLFPLSIALGVDIFDSAAYVLFARDDRLLSPTGTIKLQDINEWPISSNALFSTTPEEVKNMDKNERTSLLSRHNLEITQAELSRCRAAIRDGKIWQLAEQRSHCSPQLRTAFLWVLDQLNEAGEGPVGESILDIISSTNPVRKGGESLSHDIELRPHILHLQALLATRWKSPGSWWDGSTSDPKRLVIIEKKAPPWRISSLQSIISYLIEEPNTIPLIVTPLGIIPFSLEDLSPWCHLDGSNEMWNISYDEDEIFEFLVDLGLEEIPYIMVPPESDYDDDTPNNEQIMDWLDRCAIVDKLALLCSISPSNGCKFTEGMSSRRSNTNRMVNVYADGKHILSPRLSDGGISLTLEGAKILAKMFPEVPNFEKEAKDLEYSGIPKICIIDDAIPFVGIGRNVMHGYISGADEHIIPGQPCLVVDSLGNLVAHGTALTTSTEMRVLKKGIAVKIRGGALKIS
ncbi:MAG: tRNA guanosine(15) transglycosylase TgtA [Candidatus Poseidoniales archaeon]